MPNIFVPIAPDTPLPNALAAINSNFSKLDNESVTKTYRQANGNAIVEGKLPGNIGYGNLYYDANGVPSILIGGGVGMRIAKPDVDVTTAADTDLILNSANNLFKIVSTGTASVSRSPSTTTGSTTVSYSSLGLTSQPSVFAFGVGGTPWPSTDFDLTGATAGLIGQHRSFSVNHFTKEITFSIKAPNYAGSSYYGFGSNDTVRYYICLETSS